MTTDHHNLSTRLGDGLPDTARKRAMMCVTGPRAAPYARPSAGTAPRGTLRGPVGGCGTLRVVTDRLVTLGHPSDLEPALAVPSAHDPVWANAPASRYTQWRGELDPATAQLRTPCLPGSADRLWYVLGLMAMSREFANSEGTSGAN